MSQNKTFAASLQYGTHYLSPGGDLRSLNLPVSGTPPYSYLKCEGGNDKTFLAMNLFNQDDTGKNNAVATFSYAVINQDIDLYGLAANAAPGMYPPFQTPTWTPAPFGSSGVVTIVPGGKLYEEMNIPTAGSGAQVTLAVRVLLTGAPLKVETWSSGACDEY